MSKNVKPLENYAKYFNIDISNMKNSNIEKLKINIENDQIYKEFIIQDKIQQNLENNKEIILPKLPSENNNMTGANDFCNYIVPNIILNGQCPGGYASEGLAAKQEIQDLILKANVTTFVCLIGEIDIQKYQNQLYPRFAQEIIKNTEKQIHFIYFPIKDYCIQDNESTINFVSILKKRVLKGEILYIHCLGGHGRTGTISIPLLQQLYGLDSQKSQEYINLYHKSRIFCLKYGCGQHMPESKEQLQQIKEMSIYNQRAYKHKN